MSTNNAPFDIMLALRSILPPILTLDMKDKFKKFDQSDIVERSSRYEAIIDDCDAALDIHKLMQDWIDRNLDPYGDCWNISSICAEFLSFSGKQPYLFGIRGGNTVYHLECAEPVGDNFRYWRVDPFNELAHFQFTSSPVISAEMWETAWYIKIHMRYREHAEFTHIGEVRDGLHARQQISYMFPDYPLPVKLLNLVAVRKYLEEGNYSYD